MRIRPATHTDARPIKSVAKASWHAAYNPIIGAESVETMTDRWYDPAVLRDRIDHEAGHFLVAERDETIIGFAAGQPSNEPFADGVISAIYVTPEDWGSGTGTALLFALTKRLRTAGIETVWLAVLAENEVGISFYESMGFKTREERTTELDGQLVAEFIMVNSV